MIYLLLLESFIFFVSSALWMWFKRPVYIYRFYKWFIVIRYGIKETYINLSNVTIHIGEIGTPCKSRSSLLFIHGAGGNIFNWIYVIESMNRGNNHFILIDLPGHGLSSIPIKTDMSIDECVIYIKESVNKLGLDDQPLHVIGQSLGGYLGAELAIKYSKQVKLLTVIAPAGFGEETNEFYEKVMKRDFSWIMPKSLEEIKSTLERSMVNPPRIPNQVLTGILEEMQQKYPFLEQMLTLWMIANIKGIFKISNQIHQPTQIIWGAEDKLLPVENADLLSKNLPNCCDNVIVINCGHSSQLEKPDILADSIMNFRCKYVNH